jgi:hypothetical protein
MSAIGGKADIGKPVNAVFVSSPPNNTQQGPIKCTRVNRTVLNSPQ